MAREYFPGAVRCWAAIAGDGELLAVGYQPAWERFDRTCLHHSNESYEIWVAQGARYTELLVESLGVPNRRVNIQDIPHGRIRKCKSAASILANL